MIYLCHARRVGLAERGEVDVERAHGRTRELEVAGAQRAADVELFGARVARDVERHAVAARARAQVADRLYDEAALGEQRRQRLAVERGARDAQRKR